MNDNDEVSLANFLFPDVESDTDLAQSLGSVADSHKACRLQWIESEDSQDVLLRVHNDRIQVTYTPLTAASIPYELKQPEELVRMCRQLFRSFEPQESMTAVLPSLQLSKRLYLNLKRCTGAVTWNQLAARLSASSGDYEFSGEMAKVMKSCSMEGEIRLCTRSKSGWQYDYAAFIGHHASIWLLRMSVKANEDWLVAVPLSRGQLCAIITEWALHPAEVPNTE
ncbi:hypothetical protein GCM10010912_06570 [Paenibacillus albidus]|uniref:Uncharacterized protein n=1 Tax=Paenibacillus albidus TaxID=2041023 RepID=A0A917C216_9BACL|nr:hypothetical protein [Paenibacillus albidus]GGF64223.1 hypothetical protein GCM10010912_06570 [Paenibacillus albidus]